MATTAQKKTKQNRRWLVSIRILIVLLWGYAIFLCWFYFFQFGLFVVPNEPTTDSPKPAEELAALRPPARDYTLLPSDHPTSKSSLHCRIIPARLVEGEERKGLVAYLHGNRGNLYECRFQIDVYLNSGYDVAMFDYRGFGESEGPVTEQLLLDDALLWYDDLKNRGYNEKEIIVWGRSFGTGMAAYIASKRIPKTLVLETPYYSFVEAIRHSSNFDWLIPDAFIRFRFPTYSFEPNIATSVHLIHGTLDEKIPFASSERLKILWEKSNHTVKLWEIPNDNHNLRESSEETKPEFIEALNQILGNR